MNYAYDLYDALEERMTSELVTKADLRIAVGELRGETAALEKALRVEIASLRAEMKNDILALENRLMHKMGGLMVALTGLLFVALKLA